MKNNSPVPGVIKRGRMETKNMIWEIGGSAQNLRLVYTKQNFYEVIGVALTHKVTDKELGAFKKLNECYLTWRIARTDDPRFNDGRGDFKDGDNKVSFRYGEDNKLSINILLPPERFTEAWALFQCIPYDPRLQYNIIIESDGFGNGSPQLDEFIKNGTQLFTNEVSFSLGRNYKSGIGSY